MRNDKKLGVFLIIQLMGTTAFLGMKESSAFSSKPIKQEMVLPIVEEKKPDILPQANPVFLPSPSPKSGFDLSKGFSNIAESVLTGVVNISTTQVLDGARERGASPPFPSGSPFDDIFKDFFEQMEKQPRRVQSLGSGFVVQVLAEGNSTIAYIVTNYHVIADAKKITAIFHDKTEIEATLKGVDDRTDLAVLKVNLESLPPEKRQITPLKWGNSHDSKVGDWVLAVGNPFGLGGTVTAGIISSIARNINLKPNPRSRVSEYVDDFIQHDASINAGNSGGPLVNTNGDVVGINTAIFSPSGGNVGIGFAIPSVLASETVAQIIQFGRTQRGWLGVRIQSVSGDMAESYGLSKPYGAIVASVTSKGPAAVAGIETGDIILTFDGKEINEKNRLSRVVGEAAVGKNVEVKVWRKGKEITLTVKLGEFETAPENPSNEPGKGKNPQSTNLKEALGLKISQVTALLAQQYQIAENVEGIIVVSVSPDSTAATLGIRPGDIIIEANQKEIHTPEDFVQNIEESKKLNRKNITLLINRKNDIFFFTLKLEDDVKSSPPSQGSPSPQG